jgi:hypothetical protein
VAKKEEKIDGSTRRGDEKCKRVCYECVLIPDFFPFSSSSAVVIERGDEMLADGDSTETRLSAES